METVTRRFSHPAPAPAIPPYALSSMISTLVLNHLVMAFLFRLMLVTSWPTSLVPSPTPLNECSVCPPMLHAAMPVDAVTATASALRTCFLRRLPMISRRRTDLPVPGGGAAGP